MAIVKSFPALRFTEKAGDLPDLCCPPYDIISDAEQMALYEKNPYNIIRLEYGNGTNRYGEAERCLSDWLKNGILAVDDKPGIYVYEEEFSLPDGQVKATRGFVARIFLTPFSENIVLPHEETLSKAKEDRYQLMDATGCNFSQIYSLYSDPSGKIAEVLDRAVKQPADETFSMGDGVTHRLWILNDPEKIGIIEAAMADRQVFIADGHHRYETAVNYKNDLIKKGEIRGTLDEAPCYQMMAFVDMDDPGLVVFPTHRLIHSLPGFDVEKLLFALSDDFAVEVCENPETAEAALAARGKITFALYAGGESYYRLTLKNGKAPARAMPGMSEAYQNLDVSVLHNVILEPHLGIDKENMMHQRNLSYTRSAGEAVQSVREKRSQCAFFVRSTRVAQIKDVALAGEKMPQKSTYFYPKLITGAVMNKFR